MFQSTQKHHLHFQVNSLKLKKLFLLNLDLFVNKISENTATPTLKGEGFHGFFEKKKRQETLKGN